MPLVTAPLTIVEEKPTAVREQPSEEWVLIELDFGPGEVVYIPSHSASIPFIPVDATILASRVAEGGLADYSMNCGYLSGRSTITAPAYTFVDKDGSLSELFRSKNLNLRSTVNRTLREYRWAAGTNFPAPTNNDIRHITAKGTWLMQNHTWSGHVVTMSCSDINRGLDKEIFGPVQYQLKSSLSTTATFIPLTLPPALIGAQDIWFERGQHYHEHSEDTGAYLRIDKTGEIVFATELVEQNGVAGLTVIRAQRLTEAFALEVGSDTEPANLPTVTEWVYIEEPVVSMVYALVTGATPDGRQLPKHWAANADTRWINRYSYGQSSSSFPLRFENPGKVRAKSWIESQVLAAFPAVNTINGEGQLTWTPIVTPTDDSAGQVLLDPSNCVRQNTLTLTHDKSEVHSAVAIDYDWDAQRERFLSKQVGLSVDSVLAHENEKTKTFALKGLHAGIHTSTQINKLAQTYGDDNFFEKQHFQIESFINEIQLGTLVAVDFPAVRDDAARTVGRLKRTMIVTGAAVRRRTRTTAYTLTGTLQIAAAAGAGLALHNMEIPEYKRGGINLATLSGISISAGRATGSITLQMGRKYYYVNDGNPGEGLEFGSGLTVTFTGNGPQPSLYIFGPFINYADLDLTGRSDNNGGQGGTYNVGSGLGKTGTRGYVGASRPGNGIGASSVFTEALSSNKKYYIRRTSWRIKLAATGNYSGGLARMPEVALNLNGGRLGGVPPDLGGTGGPGGGASDIYDSDRQPQIAGQTGGTPSPVRNTVAGSNGGKGGGGLTIVSWGGLSQGRITLTGGRAAQPASTSLFGQQVVAGEGGPGGPGCLAWIVDGNHPAPTFTSSNVHAYHGARWLVGRRTIRGGVTVEAPGGYRGNQEASPPVNMWLECARAYYTPAAESAQSPQRGAIADFFSRQRDGVAKLFVQPTAPTNADDGDMWVTQAALDANPQQPVAKVFVRGEGFGGADFNWLTGEFAAYYQGLLSLYRQYGTTEWYSGPTRPTNFLSGSAWTNSNTGETWIIYGDGRPDTLVYQNESRVGENKARDPVFDGFAQGRGFWVVLDDKNTEPRYPAYQASSSGSTSNPGGGSQGGGTIEAPTNGSFTRHSISSGAVVWTPVPASNVTGTGFQYRIRREGGAIVTLDGRATSNLQVDSLPLDAITWYVRLEREDGDFSDEITIVRAAEAGGSSGSVEGTPTLPALTLRSGGWTRYSSTSGALTWNEPSAEDAPGTGYIYRIQQITPVNRTDTRNEGRAVNSFIAENLTPDAVHNWQVRIELGEEYGPWLAITGDTTA